MLDPKQMHELVRETLALFEGGPDEPNGVPYSTEASILVLGTMLIESRLTYIRQLRGPARGLIQMEPETGMDIWKNYLRYRTKRFREPFVRATGLDFQTVFASEEELDYYLRSNIALQIVMARLHYWRSPTAMPQNITDMAALWKRHYNTRRGAGKAAHFIELAQEHLVPILGGKVPLS